MSIRNFIAIFSACILILVICSCENSPELTIKTSGIDTAIKPIKVSLSELVIHYKNYQGKYIETSGEFHTAFEEFAIYTDKSLMTGEAGGFWLNADKSLEISRDSFYTMNGKRIIIRGFVDTTDKGHLEMYLAAISKINYWVVH